MTDQTEQTNHKKKDEGGGKRGEEQGRGVEERKCEIRPKSVGKQ